MGEELLVASGAPTKSFFVNMLTRDIDLRDAILDLLDNCLDGVVRLKDTSNPDDKEYYSNYCANINITSESFTIRDNCGGIPLDIAKQYAFRMGRLASDPENNQERATVGVYGIGMKRAIFKMGDNAIIKTRHGNTAYSVLIDEDWIGSESNWDFPITIINDYEHFEQGTEITIEKLNDNIKLEWNDNNLESFIESLKRAIQESYSFIIQKGFSIKLNGNDIKPSPIQLLISDADDGIKPYVYEKQYFEQKVTAKLIMGFYKTLQTDSEDDETTENRRTTAQAGWTVTCNDRVVLYNDKTHITGWGEAGVPNFHNQFIGICGVVMFQSSDPELLPMTTTKRGIDLSSIMYADIKNVMRDALKTFTAYTNNWKNRIKEERTISSKADPVSIIDVFSKKEDYGIKSRNRKGAQLFKPALPKPLVDKKVKIIRYSKDEREIDLLRQFFYKGSEESEITPSEVGEKAFDEILKQVGEGE